MNLALNVKHTENMPTGSVRKSGCVIMASGLSRRYGKNKLFELFNGKTFLQHILDITDNIFSKRIVVTRSEEAAEYCRLRSIPVILHTLPGRNDTIKLGVSCLHEMDELMFCPCDQPLLTKKSLKKMLDFAPLSDDFILRLGYKNRAGAPVLFSKKYFPELCSLPDKKGGSYLIRKYPSKVHIIQAQNVCELLDADTPENLSLLKAYLAATIDSSPPSVT